MSLARRDIIEDYEALCAEAGAHAGIVDLATFNVINAVLAATPRGGATADWLLVNVAPDDASIAILRGPHLIFFRNRAADTEGTLADLVHQAAMYYEDRLRGGGFSARVPDRRRRRRPHHAADIEQLRRSLQERLTTPVETVDPRTAATPHRPDRGRAGAARHADTARRPVAARAGRRMIRTNLSTRPFYNERIVHIWLLAFLVVVIAATAFNVTRILQYSQSDTRAEHAGGTRRSPRRGAPAAAARLRTTVDPQQIEFASLEARQANDLIDRRTFSWTELFNKLESTLPDDVRITSFRSKVDKGQIVLTIAIVARGAEDVSKFMDNMKSTGAFTEVGATLEERMNEDGQLQASLEVIYLPMVGHAAGAEAGAR